VNRCSPRANLRERRHLDAGFDCSNGGLLRAEDDIVISRWRGLNLPDTGNVRVMSAAYPEYSPATSNHHGLSCFHALFG